MELLGRSLQRFVLDLTESLQDSPQNLYSIPSEIFTDFTEMQITNALQSPHGGMPAQYLPTLTDVLTENSREPHMILPESSHFNTESLHHPDRLLPVTCQETFPL